MTPAATDETTDTNSLAFVIVPAIVALMAKMSIIAYLTAVL